MGLSHLNAEAYYRMIFSMAQFHNYSIADIEKLIPFEREIYSTMIASYLEKKEEAIAEAKRKRGR